VTVFPSTTPVTVPVSASALVKTDERRMKAINRYARRFVLIKVDSPQEMRWRMRVGVSTVSYGSTIAALQIETKPAE
jgi:hypothetical protein